MKKDDLLTAINTGSHKTRGALWYSVGRYVYVPLALVLCLVALIGGVAFKEKLKLGIRIPLRKPRLPEGFLRGKDEKEKKLKVERGSVGATLAVARGQGGRIATASVRAGLAMTGFLQGVR
ncbi:MAG: hypothetical protein ACLUNQ_07820 [Oscillospiraceae bacterium]